MKIRRLVLALLALAFALTLQSPGTGFAQAYKKKYSAKLISPKPGQVLTPGQVVRIQWAADFPDVDLSMCETEILLSLDGGKTPGGELIFTSSVLQRGINVLSG